mmetsp:Transcript_3774/g.5639  ORF Transcript_3774/g.5639 Transcript_3774/m.5639 type:complete len:473 (+) Transcript_3774:77-1495(+)
MKKLPDSRRKRQKPSAYLTILIFYTPMAIVVFFFFKLSRLHGTLYDMGLKPTSDSYLTTDFGFHPQWHPTKRIDRFPTIIERLHIYMSNWYAPACNSENTDEHIGFSYLSINRPSYSIQNIQAQDPLGWIETTPEREGAPVALHEETLQECEEGLFSRSDCRRGLRLISFVKKNFPSKLFQNKIVFPIIAKFGPTAFREDVEYPYFQSFRDAASVPKMNKSVKKASQVPDCQVPGSRDSQILQTVAIDGGLKKMYSPIIYDLYDFNSTLQHVLERDISWDEKKDMAIWRGNLNGFSNVDNNNFKAKCRSNLRCLLVLNSIDSTYVDAGVTAQQLDPRMLEGNLSMLKENLTLEEHLQHKVLILVEGDDFAQSLALALYSGSVVIMPKPKKTGYLMEEALVPWLHYIEVKEDWSDLEKKVKWAIRKSDKAKKIAERGSYWIHDLYIADGAFAENERIRKEIMKRYLDFFVKDG